MSWDGDGYMGSNITVIQYDPEWARLYEELRDFVRPVLTDLVVTIEYVGSTSVPGLAPMKVI
ncbi:GrpB family protein [Paenibacillus sp. V4I9]|uniref:GrpB family protein n=1 Tax=Paenibacillus sp. V4I9 TaxID=3042308 RepID=UPI003593C2D5